MEKLKKLNGQNFLRMNEVVNKLNGRLGALLFVALVYLCCASALYGQGEGQGNPMFRKPQTRAVVVGISNYQNIPDLEFADRDAEALAAYLQSKAGGEVPGENIRLLLNEEATQMHFAMALDWLQEESQKGDRAYIYFSGHGDVEKKTARQRGFLLNYNAPSTTYMAGGAFPIVFLQDIISELSMEKGVEVILIADACRSGKLAGDAIDGNHLTAERLAEKYANEIKIMSCQKQEASQEGPQWGGGRGAFSYHLIEGLIGMADDSGDGEVDLREIRNYLEILVSQETGGAQNPTVVGDLTHSLAKVDNESLAMLRKEKSKELYAGSSEPLVNRRSMEETDPDSLIWEKYKAFDTALQNKHLLYPEEGAAYTIFREIADESIMEDYREEMKRNLAIALDDEAQQAINDYLVSSPDELQRRWSHSERYDYYPEYLSVAADLLGQQHFMYEDLRAKQLYFEGLQLRLAGERKKEQALFEQAFDKQEAVVRMDSSAAYAYNEIGLLLRRMKRKPEATSYFEKALEQSPTWVLPMANEVTNYAETGMLKEAEMVAKKALAIDSTFALTYNNLGYSYKEAKKWEDAIAAYKKAISLDPDYPDPYYNLALVYYYDEAFDQAEKYFLEYTKKQYEPDPSVWSNLGYVADLQDKQETAERYYQQALTIDPEFSLTYFNLGELYLKQGQLKQAELMFQKYQDKEPEDQDGYYMQAAVLAEKGDVDGAIEQLKKAFEQGFDEITKLQEDKYFKSLQNEKAFKQMLEQLKK